MNNTEHILITGGTGFIGQYLMPVLLQQGHQVSVLGRDANKIRRLFGNTVTAVTQLSEIQRPVNTIINLAGASIGESRWSAANKQRFVDSRIHTTQTLLAWVKQQEQRPQRIINGSAIGYYGTDASLQWQQVCDETYPPQPEFVSQLCLQWEQVADEFEALNLQVVKLRLGLVMGKGAMAFDAMLKPIRYGKIGTIGSGRQPVVWIHIDDVVAVVCWLLQQPIWHHSVYNLVAPQITSQADFARTAAKVLKTQAPLRMPARLLRLVLGEQSDLILNGQKVVPKYLLEQGFQFQYTDLKQALQQLLRS